jgi:hypothetical protein
VAKGLINFAIQRLLSLLLLLTTQQGGRRRFGLGHAVCCIVATGAPKLPLIRRRRSSSLLGLTKHHMATRRRSRRTHGRELARIDSLSKRSVHWKLGAKICKNWREKCELKATGTRHVSLLNKKI